MTSISILVGYRLQASAFRSPESEARSLVYCPKPGLFSRVRNQGKLTRAHDRRAQLSLVHRAASRNPARQNLRPLGHERHQELGVLVIDVVDLVRAELTDLAPTEHRTTLPVLPLLPALRSRLP